MGAADLSRMQNFLQCHQVLTSCSQQQQNGNGSGIMMRQQNGNGHHVNGNGHHANGNGHHTNGNGHNGNIMNGASGCMTNGNGVHHNNGNHGSNGTSHHFHNNSNGHSNGNGGMSRKRSFVDESIPQFKRARTNAPAAPPMVAPSPSTLTASTKSLPQIDNDVTASMDDVMDSVITCDDVTSYVRETYYASYLQERQIQFYHGS